MKDMKTTSHDVYVYGGFLFLVTFLLALINFDSFFWSDDFWLMSYALHEHPFQYWFTRRENFNGYWPYLKIHFSQPDALYYWYFRPVTTLSFKLDLLLAGGISSVLMHISQAVWAGLASVAFWLGIRRIASVRVAAVAALLFAVLPLHAEVHSWISARSGILSLLFVMLALWAAGAYRLPTIPRVLLTALFTMLAVLSKSDAAMVVLWLGAGALIYYKRDAFAARSWAYAALVSGIVVAATLLCAKVVFAPSASFRIESMHLVGLHHPLFVFLYLSNLAKNLLLLNLWMPAIPGYIPLPVSIAAILGIPAVWLLAIKKLEMGRVGLAMLALMILPMIPLSLVPAEERLLFFSSAAYCVLMALLLVALAKRWPVLARPRLWIPALVLLSLFSLYHHYVAGSHGRLTFQSAQAIVDGCGPFEPNERVYVPNAIWPVAFLNKAVVLRNHGKPVDIMRFALDMTAVPHQADVPETYTWFLCMMDTWKCNPPYDIRHRLYYTEKGLRLELKSPGFFTSLLENFVGFAAKFQNTTGELYHEEGAFRVSAYDLNPLGYPQTLLVDFEEPDPAICVREGMTYKRLPLPTAP